MLFRLVRDARPVVGDADLHRAAFLFGPQFDGRTRRISSGSITAVSAGSFTTTDSLCSLACRPSCSTAARSTPSTRSGRILKESRPVSRRVATSMFSVVLSSRSVSSYRSSPKNCRDCPYQAKCEANENGQTLLTRHIWQSYLDAVESIRKTEDAKCMYAMRQQTIERVFADAKEKHAMRYTHHRGLTAVTRWVKLNFAAMNLKRLAVWSWKNSFLSLLFPLPFQVFHKTHQNPCLAAC